MTSEQQEQHQARKDSDTASVAVNREDVLNRETILDLFGFGPTTLYPLPPLPMNNLAMQQSSIRGPKKKSLLEEELVQEVIALPGNLN